MSIIGIDFGTSLNKIGCINQNIFKIITNNYKNPSTPSVAFLNHKDRWFFGERAAKLGLNKPGQYIFETKLMLGETDKDIFEKRKKYWNLANIDQENHVILIVKVDKEEQKLFPKEVTSKILKNLIDISKSDLPPEVNNTIISIPAKFTNSQINDMSEAAKLAGFQNVLFVYDPILASIAYLFNMQENIAKPRNILVYNLGASFLSVSILQINSKENNNNNKITTEFDKDVDIHQVDEKILKYANEEFLKTFPHKKDFFNNPKTQRKLANLCIEAKVFQSKNDSSEIVIEDEDDDDLNNLSITLTYDKFNEINEDFFNKTMNAVDKVLKNTGIDEKSINDLFLVGGSTFLIKIREQLKEKIGKDPCTYADPREVVALGACIVGLDISLQKSSEEERKSIQNTSIYLNNQEFFENLKEFRKFTIQTEFSVDEKGDVIYEEIQPLNYSNENEKYCNFSLGNYSSLYSSNFSSAIDGHSLSPANSEEEKIHKHKELNKKEVKPIRNDSIIGKLISVKNLPEENSYAVVSIVKHNYDVKDHSQEKSKLINNSSDPLYNLDFSYEKVKKGHYLMIEIFSSNEDNHLIGKLLIRINDLIGKLLNEVKEGENVELNLPLKKLKKSIKYDKLKNLPENFEDFESNVTVKLNLMHTFEYTYPK